MSTQEIIYIGAQPNDGEGDPLRIAFEKVNNNFANLFSTFVNTSNTYSIGNTAGQVLFETPANTFTMGQFYIYSADPITDESQTIQLFAQLSTNLDEVKFTGYGSTFIGNAVSRFDMDVLGGNVRILCDPLTTNSLFHFVASQNMWVGQAIPGIPLGLDGYVSSSMSTEDDLLVTTESA
jgi:hypothetical protein